MSARVAHRYLIVPVFLIVVLSALPTIAQKSATPAGTAYEAGVAALRKGDVATAETAFRKALALDSRMLEAYMGLAEARRAAGSKASDVIGDEYSKVLGINKDYWKAWEAAGCACLEDKDWSCNKYFNEVIRIRPEYARGYTGYARGILYGMPSSNASELIENKALPALRKAVALDPKSGEAWYETGNAHRMSGRPDSALNAYSKAIASQSGLALPYALRGDLRVKQGQLSEAYADYTKAMSTDPKLLRAWTGRGTVNTLLREYPAALEDFNKALALNPKDFNALIGRGIVHRAEGRYTDAITDFTAADAIAVKDEHNLALKERGIAHQLNRNETAAFNDIETAYLKTGKFDTGFAELAYLYGQAYERRGHPSPAKDMYARSLSSRESPVVRAALDRATAADNAALAASRTTYTAPVRSYSGRSYERSAAPKRKWVTERCNACSGEGKIYYEKLAVGGGLSSGGSTYYSTVNQYGTKTYGSSAGMGSVTCSRCKGSGKVSGWEYEDDEW